MLDYEYHFVMECALFDDLRKKHIHVPQRNMQCFIDLLNTSDVKVCNNLGNYIRKSFIIKRANESIEDER